MDKKNSWIMNHTVRSIYCYSLFNMLPIVERAHDSNLVNADGKEYIDLLAGFSVSALGECNEEITNTIQQQASELVHYFDLPHPERIKLSEKLADISPVRDNAKVVYGVTGSDAIELSISSSLPYG